MKHSPEVPMQLIKSILNGIIYFNQTFITDFVLVYDTRIIGVFSQSEYTLFKETHESIEEIDAHGAYVTPGFIDVHIHGYKGFDTMDGDITSLTHLAKAITENGVTSFLPTTMTMPLDAIRRALDTINTIKNNHDTLNTQGAMVLGAHLEGPFINEAYKGAQPKEFIHLPDSSFVQEYAQTIKVITLSPETSGALQLIDQYKESIRFSIGHSGATYEQAMGSFERGACCTTHLFNAMTGLHHRKPGIVGAALASSCYSEVIADTIHIHPGLFSVLLKAKGADKLLLITDCMRAGGLAEGTYELGGQVVQVKNGMCTLMDGTIAGSVLTLNKGLHNFKQATHSLLETLLPLVTSNQATYLGVDSEMGTLEVGKLANIVIMDESVSINKTIVKGQIVYENQV